ncbi:Imm26 family immunity protein [Sutcliffiella horikoshii]|uniref:Imm26 family immunity protein n=1 Tax=Sutcliffiella horikoshii TaxID=79883 RepID=UPI001F33348E|nr:Imm26 family immunity protein [Sutcliffiella horikoshii]MCG1021474.1 hypothetical protein [Sutcliffiella horikoshii]
MKCKGIKLGDVYAIPLPDGKFAFGRRFKDAGIAIYSYIGISIADIPRNEDYQFIVGVYEDILKSGEWTYIENRPFHNEEEAWPPPACLIDSITGDYSIYHRGEIKDANKEECVGLEIAAVWEGNQIIDRIMGDDKWHRDPLK